MSDLQIGLLAIGAVIVLAVLLFNWMQERRFRKQAEAAFQMPVADALLKPGAVPRDPYQRLEPELHEPAFDSAPSRSSGPPSMLTEEDDAPVALEQQADAVAARATPAAAATPRPAVEAASNATPVLPYDDLIEYRVRIGGHDIQAGVFAEAVEQTRGLGKAVRWNGLSEGGAEWEEIQPWRDARYQQVVVTLQLADRNGAVEEAQLTALCQVLQKTGQVYGFPVACDDVIEAMERAHAIDRFCVDVDVLIGLNVVARGEGTVNLTRIVSEAEGRGMTLASDGVFQLLDSRGEPLYALCNHDAEPFCAEAMEGQTSQGVTLQFDVPRVPDGVRVFDGMVAFGRKLANEIGGILVDDNLRPLTDTGIEKIRMQLTQIYQRMEARGVPSGSRRALRLFS